VAESVNRIVSPSVSVDRAIGVERERDRNREREKDERKRAAPTAEKSADDDEAPADSAPAEESNDPKKGHSLNIKV
jgi:hypothetical protein